VREGFIRQAAPKRAEVLKEQFAAWGADLVVCDEMDYGSLLAAETMGLPYATVVVNASGTFATRADIGEALHEVRAAQGLPLDPELRMLDRHLVLVPYPPRFRDPAIAWPDRAYAYRPPAPERVGPPVWPVHHPGAPTVYFTLVTVFNMESGDLFRRVLTGLRELPINLVVTVGAHIDPAEFGPQPDHIHLTRFIPQAQVLPHCDLVVSHGGSGSVIASLAHGLPSVLLPLGADQPDNSQRCQDLGIGQVLNCVTATPDEIRRTVAHVLADPGYRQRAQAFREEAAALPGVETVVSRLAALVSA
jgi:MGT family glycosyltransferase